MNDKEFRVLKARIAYRQFVESLPKCSECRSRVEFEGRRDSVTACMQTKKIIDKRVKTCPTWCPYREA